MSEKKSETAEVKREKAIIPEDYERFGDEWKKEMMKLKKSEIVDLFAGIGKRVFRNDHFHVTGYVVSADPSVFNEIWQERKAQNEKWGEQNHHPFVWLAILGEEVGEANKAVVEAEFNGYEKKYWLEYREELIQIAAVAEAMVESLDRNQLSE